MRLLLNAIWFLFSGLWMALGYVVAGLLACLLIVTIPFGLQAFKIAGYALWPFGRSVIRTPTAGGASTLGNVVWFVFCGWWLALGHIVSAALLAVTIIGLPFAYANLKLVPVSLTPFGREIVPSGQVGRVADVRL